MSSRNVRRYPCNRRTCEAFEDTAYTEAPTKDKSWPETFVSDVSSDDKKSKSVLQRILPNRAYCFFGNDIKKSKTDDTYIDDTSPPSKPPPEPPLVQPDKQSFKSRFSWLFARKEPTVSKSAMLLCPHCLQAIPENLRRIISQELINIDIKDLQKAKENLEVGISCNCGGTKETVVKRQSILKKNVEIFDSSQEPPQKPPKDPVGFFTRRNVPDVPPNSPAAEDVQYIDQFPQTNQFLTDQPQPKTFGLGQPMSQVGPQSNYPNQYYDNAWQAKQLRQNAISPTSGISDRPAVMPQQANYPNYYGQDSVLPKFTDDAQYIQQMPQPDPLVSNQQIPRTFNAMQPMPQNNQQIPYPNQYYNDPQLAAKSQPNAFIPVPSFVDQPDRRQVQPIYPDNPQQTRNLVSGASISPNQIITDGTQYVQQPPQQNPLLPDQQKPITFDQPLNNQYYDNTLTTGVQPGLVPSTPPFIGQPAGSSQQPIYSNNLGSDLAPNQNLPIQPTMQDTRQIPTQDPIITNQPQPQSLYVPQPALQNIQQQPNYPNDSINDTWMSAKSQLDDSVNPESDQASRNDNTEQAMWSSTPPIDIPQEPAVNQAALPDTTPADDRNQASPDGLPTAIDIPFAPLQTSTPRQSLQVDNKPAVIPRDSLLISGKRQTQAQPDILPVKDEANTLDSYVVVPPETTPNEITPAPTGDTTFVEMNDDTVQSNNDLTIIQTALVKEIKPIDSPENAPPNGMKGPKLRFFKTRPRTLRQCALSMRNKNVVPIPNQNVKQANPTTKIVQYVNVERFSDRHFLDSFNRLHHLPDDNNNNTTECNQFGHISIERVGSTKYVVKCKNPNCSSNSNDSEIRYSLNLTRNRG